MFRESGGGKRKESSSIFSEARQDVKGKEEILNLAFRNINGNSLPTLLRKHGRVEKIKTLDLSYNNFEDLSSLYSFECLETLVLDHNKVNCNTTFPNLPNLKMVSLNSNMISNLSLFIRNLAASLPGLRYLSLMKNEAAPSYFNGGSVEQFQDYRFFIVSHFAKLDVLDDRKITDEERSEAFSTYGRRWKVRKGRSRANSKSKPKHA